MKYLYEELQINAAIKPLSTAAAQTSAAYLDMGEFTKALVVVTSTLTAGESISVQLKSASDATGTGTTALSTAIVVNSTGTGYLEVDAADMPAARKFLGVTATPTGTVEMAVTILLGQGREEPVTQTVDASKVV